MPDVTINTSTDPITVSVDDSPIVVSTDQTPSLGGGGGGGYAPDPSAQADDKWLKTTGGAYVFTDPPTGTTNPSDSTPQPVSAGAGVAGVSTAFARADHVHLGAPTSHNHNTAYAQLNHNHDEAYLSASEIIAGANVTVDLVTTPGSVIIGSTAAGGVSDHGLLASASLADDDHPQYLNTARGDARYLRPVSTASYVISAPSTNRIGAWEVQGDGSDPSTWPDRFAFAFKPSGGSARQTGFFNEYGELRSQAALNTSVALRAMGTGSSSGRIFDVLTDQGGTEVLAATASSVFARQQEVVTSPGSSVLRLVALSQVSYNGIGTPDPFTIYFITE
jgi:hypothetical protein